MSIWAMAQANYPYLDLTVLPAIRNHVVASNAALLFDEKLESLLWANGEGVLLIGASTIRNTLEDAIMPTPTMMRQIHTAVDKLSSTEEAAAMVRVRSGFKTRLLPITARFITLPEGERAVFITSAQIHGPRHKDQDMAQVAVNCLDGYSHASAILNDDGTVLAASQHFLKLEVMQDELKTLSAEIMDESDRLIKRPIQTAKGLMPAGLALLDAPSNYKMLIIADNDENIVSNHAAQAVMANARQMPQTGVTKQDASSKANALDETTETTQEPIAEPTPEPVQPVGLFSNKRGPLNRWYFKPKAKTKEAATKVDPAPETETETETKPEAKPEPITKTEPEAQQENEQPVNTAASVEPHFEETESKQAKPEEEKTSEQSLHTPTPSKEAASNDAPQEHGEKKTEEQAEKTASNYIVPTAVTSAALAAVALTGKNEDGNDQPADQDEVTTPSVQESASAPAGPLKDAPAEPLKEKTPPQLTEAEEQIARTKAILEEAALREQDDDALDDAQSQKSEHSAAQSFFETSPLEDETSVQPSQAEQDKTPDLDDGQPVRFVWEMNADHQFVTVSKELAATVGPHAAQIVGQSWDDVATRFQFNNKDEIADLLDKHDTWSNRTVLWPVQNTDLRIPIDLAGLPAYNRDKEFKGFNGFGIARTGDEMIDPNALGLNLPHIPNHDRSTLDPKTLEQKEIPSSAHTTEERVLTENEKERFEEIGETLSSHSAASVVAQADDHLSNKSLTETSKSEPAEEKPVEKTASAPVTQTASPAKDTQALPFTPSAFAGPARFKDNTKSPKLVIPTAANAPKSESKPERVPAPTARQVPEQKPEPKPELAPVQTTAKANTAPIKKMRVAPDNGTVDTSILSSLPIPVLVYRNDELLFCNDTFFETTGYQDIEELANAGGLDALFCGGLILEETSPPQLVCHKNGQKLNLTPLLQRVPWDKERAMLMTLREPHDDDDNHGDAPDTDGDHTPRTDNNNQPDTGNNNQPDTGNNNRPDTGNNNRPDTGNNDQPDAGNNGQSGTEHNDRLSTSGNLKSKASSQDTHSPSSSLVNADQTSKTYTSSALSTVQSSQETTKTNTQELREVNRSHTQEANSSHVTGSTNSTSTPSPDATIDTLSRLHNQIERNKIAHNETEQGGEKTTPVPFGGLGADDLRSILDTATDGIIILSDEGIIRAINRSAEALFDVNAEDVIDYSITKILAPESHRSTMDYISSVTGPGIGNLLNDGREVIGKTALGGLIPIFLTLGKFENTSGCCAVMRDITHWKKAEEELITAKAQADQANAQKSEFLAKVSHEIRTPLNAIIGFSDMMIEERFGEIENDRYRGYLRDINRSGNHVLELINDLLDISKIEAGKMEMTFDACDLNTTISETVALSQPQANKQRVIIRTSLSAVVPQIVADPRSLRQIILNLVSNSIKFTEAGGQVIVSTVYEQSGEVVLRVRDTGIGMSDLELAKALRPFQQINPHQNIKGLEQSANQGTGLGLPLTKALVEANRAHFHIESKPHEGTLVEIHFPIQRVLADR